MTDDPRRLARIVLSALILTFVASRVLVFLIMEREVPDLFLHVGGTHVHHLNYGIFLLSCVGGVLLFSPPSGRARDVIAIAYGIGLALTFDEFGMWLHLGGSYWQRASWDAMVVLVSLFGLLASAPTRAELDRHHIAIFGILVLSMGLFFVMLVRSLSYAERIVAPKLLEIERTGPS